MNTECANTKIYWTKDYGLFKFIQGNRDLNETKIKKLIADVKNGLDLFKYCPILVTEEYHIIDGQHRLLVCRKMGLNVYYIIVPNFTLRQIAALNNNQNRWRMRDFLNCYIDAGKNRDQYVILKDFIEKYKIPISMGAHLLSIGKVLTGGSVDILEAFRRGEFEVKRIDDAEKLMVAASEYSEFTEYNFTRDFLLALQKLRDGGKFNQKEMVEKLKKNNLKILQRNNHKEYLIHFEELFNFKNSIRKTIY